MSSAFYRSCLGSYLSSLRNVANTALLNLPLHSTRNANPSIDIVYDFSLLSLTNCMASLSIVVIESDIYVNGYYNIFDIILLDLELLSIIVSILLLPTSILSLLVSTLPLREIDIYIYTIVDSANN